MLTRFAATRELTEELARPLGPEDQTVQSMPDVSPTKWHRAHTTWFFETFVLERYERDFAPYRAGYRELFNSYYQGIGPQFTRADRGLISRPTADEVGAYRRDVDHRVERLLDTVGSSERPVVDGLVELGIHHEQQHQELLLMDVKHVLSINPLRPVYRPDRQPIGQPGTANWIEVDPGDGVVEVGWSGDGFSFDNELPRHRTLLEPFRITDRLVTAGEWIAFIADGGYRRPDLWLSDGWHAVVANGWEAPLYWIADGDDWVVHTLGGTRSIDPNEPVCHISHYEADAFARWAGARLPTEFEWEHAVATVGTDRRRPFDLDALQPAAAAPASGRLRQAFGDCWQWTSSAYLPYPGFTTPPGAVGEYNGKFMSGQMVLRGSSASTPDGHDRTTYRNFFPPHARWMVAGVRLAQGGDS